MKVLFVGPTLFDAVCEDRLSIAPDLVCQPPACQGDIARAVLRGATVIGLVDGRYEDVAAPWHKEILFALGEGVTVLGAGSLGALRAAECASFGMIGIGQNFQRYVSGELVDDADVAQLHAPAEFGCFPITEAFVNVEATIRQAESVGDLAATEANALLAAARRIFFKELTFAALAARFYEEPVAVDRLLQCLARNRVDIKRLDALALVYAMSALPDKRHPQSRTWQLAEPATWLTFINRLKAELECLDPLTGVMGQERRHSVPTAIAA